MEMGDSWGAVGPVAGSQLLASSSSFLQLWLGKRWGVGEGSIFGVLGATAGERLSPGSVLLDCSVLPGRGCPSGGHGWSETVGKVPCW